MTGRENVEWQAPPGIGMHYGRGISHLDEHCRWMWRAGRAPRTIRARRMNMQYLADYLGRDPVDATQFELEDWQDTMARSTMRFRTATTRPYYDYLQKRQYRLDNPAALLVTPKAKKGIPRPIAFDAMEWAIRSAPTRIRVWLLLAAYAGLRAVEIAHLTMANFEHHPDGSVFIHLTHTKGMVPRYTAIPPWVWENIQPHLAESGPCFRRERGTGPVTPQQISQHCNDWLHKSGTNSTLHSLRHWAGTSGIFVEDSRVVQSFLGHASPATTAVYAEVQPQRIAAMVETFRQVDLSS